MSETVRVTAGTSVTGSELAQQDNERASPVIDAVKVGGDASVKHGSVDIPSSPEAVQTKRSLLRGLDRTTDTRPPEGCSLFLSVEQLWFNVSRVILTRVLLYIFFITPIGSKTIKSKTQDTHILNVSIKHTQTQNYTNT